MDDLNIACGYGSNAYPGIMEVSEGHWVSIPGNLVDDLLYRES